MQGGENIEKDAKHHFKKAQEDDSGWFNYYDELVESIKKAEKHGFSFADVMSFRAFFLAAQNREENVHLRRFLVNKGIMTQDDLLQIDKDVEAVLKQKRDETAKKYPSLTESLKQLDE
ncbi:MAG: hypothetical protein ACXV2E_02740 [Halobacteriota archaeon]